MNTDPTGHEPVLTDGDEGLDGVDVEVVEDLDAAEDAEGVVGGFSSKCMSG